MTIKELKEVEKIPGEVIAVEIDEEREYVGVIKIGNREFPYKVDMSEIPEDVSEEELDNVMMECVKFQEPIEDDTLKFVFTYVVYDLIGELLLKTSEKSFLKYLNQQLQEKYERMLKNMGFNVSANNYVGGIKEFKINRSLLEFY